LIVSNRFLIICLMKQLKGLFQTENSTYLDDIKK